MKRLILCGFAILTILGLVVGTAYGRGWRSRGSFYRGRGASAGSLFGGAVLGGILGGLGARPYYYGPHYYGPPIVGPHLRAGYSYRDARPDYHWCRRKRTSECLDHYPSLRD